MSATEYDELLRAYAGRITGPSEEADLIRSGHLMLGWSWNLAALIKSLQLEAARSCELPNPLKFSLVLPLSNTPPGPLHEFLLSVHYQSWFRWEVILIDDASEQRDHLAVATAWAAQEPRIRLVMLKQRRGPGVAKNTALAAATGDFVCIFDEPGLLHPSALCIFARHLICAPDVNLIFSNEARIDDAPRRVRRFIRKAEFDLFTELRHNYIGQLTAIRTDLLLAARKDGEVFRPEYDGVGDHDLMIRIGLTGAVKAMNVPYFLYFSRTPASTITPGAAADPDVSTMRLRLIEEHLSELYPGARWELIPPTPSGCNQHPGIHLRALPHAARPSLLVMIPFKDQSELTLRCLDSIERQQHELDLLVVAINSRSRDPETVPRIRAWLDQPRRNRYELVDDDGAFNFARMHNAVFESYGRSRDLLLFLNNDAEILSTDALQTMAMQLLADESCGFVGIRLLYPDDGSVQHGGIKVRDRVLSVCGCHEANHSRSLEEYVGDEQIAFGVTFACAMTRRATFERLGKLEEILYPNGFGDVALCARALEAGLKNYYFGTLVGLHYEAKTRTRCVEDVEYVTVYERYSAVFSYWMLRDLSYCDVPDPLPPAIAELAPSASIAGADFPAPQPSPLRYWMADRINDAFKTVLGPVHPALRSSLLWGRALLQRIRGSLRSRRPIPGGSGPRRFHNGEPAARGPHRNRGIAVDSVGVSESGDAAAA